MIKTIQTFLSIEQQRFMMDVRQFVQQEIIPVANQNDRQEYTPPELIRKIAQQGYLGALIPTSFNGFGLDMISLGLLHAEIGRGCSSIRSLLTVHSMVAHAICRWGTQSQKDYWLPRLASGDVIGAFALSEPEAGSDINSIATEAVLDQGKFVLNGVKKWTTYGQLATLFLVFAQCQGKPCAFLVEYQTPGLSRKPITGLLGTRASMLAELRFDQCEVPSEHLVGGNGFGLAAVAHSCLNIGRYSVAWGCAGIAQACLDAALEYSATRKQFGVLIKDHQLIQQMITDMIVGTDAAVLMCYQAGYLHDQGNPEMLKATWIAKYFASNVAVQAANNAVQIHGANGCSADYAVQRYLRDAKVMQIIEGSSQIQQMTIARFGYL